MKEVDFFELFMWLSFVWSVSYVANVGINEFELMTYNAIENLIQLI